MAIGGGLSSGGIKGFDSGFGTKRSGFSTDELKELLEKQGIRIPEETPKAGFLQRLTSFLRVGETAEARIRSIEKGTEFLENYRNTAMERLSTALTGDLPKKPDRTYEDYLKMKGWVDKPGLDLTDFAGFVGDVLLDPTTYLTVGTGAGIKVATKTGVKTLTRQGSTLLTKKIEQGLAREAAEEAVIKQLGKQAFRKKAVRLAGVPVAPLRQGESLLRIGTSKVPILRDVYDSIGKAFKWDYKPIGESYDIWAKRIKATEKYRAIARSARPLTRLEIKDWVKTLDQPTAKQVTKAIEEISGEFGDEAANEIVTKAIRQVDANDVSRVAERAVQFDSPRVAEMMDIRKQLQNADPDEAIDLQKRLFQLSDDAQLQDELARITADTENGKVAKFVTDVQTKVKQLDEARLASLLKKLESKALYSELPAHAQRAAKAATEIAFKRQKALSRAGVSVGDLNIDDFMVGGYIAHVPTKDYMKLVSRKPELRKFVTGNAEKAKSRTLKGSANSINDDFKLSVAISNHLRKTRPDVSDTIIQSEFDNLWKAVKKGTDSVDDKLKNDLEIIRREAEKLPEMFETDIRVIAEAMGVGEKEALARRQFLNDLHKIGEPAPEIFRVVNGKKQIDHIVDPGFAQVKSLPGLNHLQFPDPVAKAIDNFGEDFFRKKEVNDLVKSYDKVQNLYKGTLTALYPSFHGRNMISNLINMSLDNSLIALRPDIQKWAIDLTANRNLGKVLTTRTGEKFTLEQIQQEGMRRGIEGTAFFRGDVGVDPQFTDWLSKLNPVKQAQRLGTKIEDQAKWAMFTDNILRGQNFDMAASITKEYLFDYGQLTSFEKNVMRRIFPFYTWSRKNLTLQARKLIEKPGKYAALFKTIRTISAGQNLDKEEFDGLPDWLQNSLVIKAGKDKYGAPRYISNLGLPIEEFTDTARQFKGLLATITGTGEESDRQQALQLAGRTAFVPKAIIERVTNVDFFLGRELTEVTNANSAMAVLDGWMGEHLINDEMKITMMNWLEIREVQKPVYRNGKQVATRTVYTGNPQKLQLLRSLPTSRVQSTLGRVKQFAEEGEAFTGEAILNFTTGMKSYTVDPETTEFSRERELEEKLEDALIRLGVLKEFSRSYIPKDFEPSREPEEFINSNRGLRR